MGQKQKNGNNLKRKQEKEDKNVERVCTIVMAVSAIFSFIATIWIGYTTDKISSESNNIAKEAQKLSKDDNMINKKQEPLIYSIKGGKKSLEYIFENLELKSILGKAPVLKIEQGVIDALRVIVFDGENIKIIEQPEWQFMNQFRMTDYSLEIKVEKNVTEMHEYKCYDYFFLYMKSGQGKEYLDLIYTEIDLTPQKESVGEPTAKTKLDLLEADNNVKKNQAYEEMMNNYKVLQKNIMKLPENGMELY